MYFDRKDDIAFVKWAYAVKRRDQFTCQICDRRGVELNAHHMNSWNAFPDERYDLDNGITLCYEHHEGFHKIYGHGDNTRFQFEEYKEMCVTFVKIIKAQQKKQDIVKEVVEKLKKSETD